MAIISRKKIVRLSAWFGVLFVLLFIFRLSYGYYGSRSSESGYDNGRNFFDNVTTLRKNYASEKILSNNQQAGLGTPGAGDHSTTQQYEKTATIKSKTSEFEKDEAVIRQRTEAFGGSIQYEQSLGKKGSRELYLSIGVRPAVFDSFYLAMQGIADLKSTVITKVDKTNEYRQLNAKKASLEKTLASLNELKNKNGAISDYVALHEKILGVETQLQELGVDLGNYNTENEYCTLRFSLFEGAALAKVTGWHRVKVALEWTIEYYAIGMVALCGVLICSFLVLLIVDRLKILSSVMTKIKD